MGNWTPLSGTNSALRPSPFTNRLSISLCSPSLHGPALPVRFPTTYCTATVGGYGICGCQGLENMSERDRLGDDDEWGFLESDLVLPSSI